MMGPDGGPSTKRKGNRSHGGLRGGWRSCVPKTQQAFRQPVSRDRRESPCQRKQIIINRETKARLAYSALESHRLGPESLAGCAE